MFYVDVTVATLITSPAIAVDRSSWKYDVGVGNP